MNMKTTLHVRHSYAVIVLLSVLSVASPFGLPDRLAGEEAAEANSETSAGVESEDGMAAEEVEVIADSAKVKIGDEVIASIKKGERFAVNRRQGPWVGIIIESEGKERLGWVLANRVQTVVEAGGSEKSTAPGPPVFAPAAEPRTQRPIHSHAAPPEGVPARSLTDWRASANQRAWAKQLGVAVQHTNSIGMKLALIPPGEFMMGSPRSDGYAHDEEKPQHKIRITKPFYLGVYEVTQAEYEKVMGRNPSRTKGAANPVEQVTWDEAAEFCRKLSSKEGKTYRLPTEAEWEYACRAGTTTRYSFGDNPANLGQYAWHRRNSNYKTHPVGGKKPNGWGLYDMHGNVWEWCADWFDLQYYANSSQNDPQGPPEGSSRLYRGGSWFEWRADRLRSAYRCRPDRFRRMPSYRNHELGFRVALGEMSEEAKAAIELAAQKAAMEEAARKAAMEKAAQKAAAEAVAAQKKQKECSQSLGSPVEITNSVGMTLKLIPAGDFVMGSAQSPQELVQLFDLDERDAKGFADEHPRHRVRITKPFYLGAREVTVGQFGQFVEATGYRTEADKDGKGGRGITKSTSITIEQPSPKYTWRNVGWSQTDAHPVLNVSWNDAVAYCQWLSKKEGKTYCLPTEAEWEYACRAGTTTRYYYGDDPGSLEQYAWRSMTHPVGEKQPNAWGLFDVHGNVAEWCADWYGPYAAQEVGDPKGPETGSGRVCRGGGGLLSVAAHYRSAHRTGPPPGYRNFSLGFRVATGTPQDAKAAMDEAAQEAASEEAARKATMEQAAQKAAQEAAVAQTAQKECSESLGSPVEITNSIGMKLMLIPAGEFMMGSPSSDDWAASEEKPQHKIRITTPFYMGRCEVTQAEYETLMGQNPSRFKGAANPVEQISWDDAVEFCKQLTVKEGKTYRLPTEAEWEYACRAGTTTRYSFGDAWATLGEYAIYRPNSDQKTHLVGEKKPNAWGLYGMHGNVGEWCADWKAEDYYATSPTDDPIGPARGSLRTSRGGSWRDASWYCRSAHRFEEQPDYRNFSLGFRVVQGELSEKAKAAMEQAAMERVAMARTVQKAASEAVAAQAAQKECSERLGTEVEVVNSIGMEFVLIPAGEFMMGGTTSPEETVRFFALDEDDAKRFTGEQPRHKVRITRPFLLGVYEVTQAEYEKVMGDNPSRLKDAANPVEMVSWDNAVEFCKRLSAKEGKTYRLPTEAEWEYACRAGTTTRYGFGDDPAILRAYAWYDDGMYKANPVDHDLRATLGAYAWYGDGSDKKPHPVGEKKPNAWGLYDMHGNVWEWCADRHGPYAGDEASDPRGPETGSGRVRRGAGWNSTAWSCGSSFRGRCSGCRHNFVGFRVVLGEKHQEEGLKKDTEKESHAEHPQESTDAAREPEATGEAKPAMKEPVAGRKTAARGAIAPQYFKYYQELVGKYDKNGDGLLERNEWINMARDPGAADVDGDGRITVEEYARWAMRGPKRTDGSYRPSEVGPTKRRGETKLLLDLKGHSQWVLRVCFSDDGGRIASAA